ncbi:dUTP diphosphatase [Candidatus Berkelbacteria bacterium]|nr:dUTP diphosphatase [Candidatus Berkelbacteria bacterium]
MPHTDNLPSSQTGLLKQKASSPYLSIDTLPRSSADQPQSGDERISSEQYGIGSRITVQLKRLSPGASVPRYEHPGDAGLDLFSAEEITLPPGGRAAIGTGWAMAFPPGFVARILGRSGLALKHGLSAALAGVVDAEYRGEWKVILLNTDAEPYTVHVGDKIAQAVFFPIVTAVPEVVSELSETQRGSGGFGSSGHSIQEMARIT